MDKIKNDRITKQLTEWNSLGPELRRNNIIEQLKKWRGDIEHIEDAFILLNKLARDTELKPIFKVLKENRMNLKIRDSTGTKTKPETVRECLRALDFLDTDIVKYIPVKSSDIPFVPQPVPIHQIVPEVVVVDDDAMDIEYNIPVKREMDIEELLEVRSSRPSTLAESNMNALLGSSVDNAINLDDEEEDYSNKTEIVVPSSGPVVKRKKPTTLSGGTNPSSPPAKKSKSKDKEATNVIKGDELERKVQEIFQHPNVVFVQFEIEKLFKQPPKN